jgi:hypothetical protein
MRKIIIGILTILPFLSFGQSEFCEKKFGESFFPLEIGFEKMITWGSSIYVEKITEKIKINGIEYFKYVQDFRNGTVYNLLLRNQNDTIFNYNKKKKTENILLIAKPIKGIKWKNSKIKEIDGSFETPYCNYENLLVIENKNSDGTKTKRYYKKGLGLVAITGKKGIKGICLPNKSKVSECTLESIKLYVSEKLSLKKFKQPREHGVLKFKMYVSKEGIVSNVETLNSIPGGKQIRKTIKNIIKSLPKFIPARTAERKTVGTTIKLDIKTN